MSVAQDLSIISAVAAFWLVAMIVPGLDFLLVTRLAVLHGRSAALQATFGIATGVAAWGVAGFFGIRTLFIAAPWLYLALKVGGGLYLATIGIKLLLGSWRSTAGATEPHSPPEPRSGYFRAGLLTNLANAKARIFIASLFAASMPRHAPSRRGLACVAAMFAVAVAGFALVTLLLSLKRVSAVFLRCRHWVDRCAGLAFMGLGIRFVTERAPD